MEGRISKKLRLMLESLGFRDVQLWPAQGHWRSDSRADVYRWEGKGQTLLGLPVNFASWNTMTNCVRSGIELDKEPGAMSSFFEVSAKEAVSSPQAARAKGGAKKRRRCNRSYCQRTAVWLYTTKQWELCNECSNDLKIDLAELEPLSREAA